ncbi:MAG TPA: DUF6580 family putative transport protein [Patescibacteria group bacterium]|nr:DUF6580 family putative transport protein [Patescibacteria group bacterium]
MKDKIIIPTLIIIFGVLLRLLPHLPNVAPITAIALFAGMYLDKKYALILPLVIMVVSDFFLGFHDTLLFVYVSFFLSGVLGLSTRSHKTAGRILLTILLASVQFFLITNFGVWLVGHLYPKNLKGLVECFVVAIPFFRNTIMGDLLFTTAFILLFEFLEYLVHRKKAALVRRK